MTEIEFLHYCKAQVSGELKEEDLVLMLTAWGRIQYSLGYNQALADNGIEVDSSTKDVNQKED